MMSPDTSSKSWSSDLALVKDYPPIPLINIEQMTEILEERRADLEVEGLSTDNYVYFQYVTPSRLLVFEDYQAENRTHYRITYFEDISTLIFKIPTGEYETAHRGLFNLTLLKLHRMGVSLKNFKIEELLHQNINHFLATLLKRILTQGLKTEL